MSKGGPVIGALGWIMCAVCGLALAGVATKEAIESTVVRLEKDDLPGRALKKTQPDVLRVSEARIEEQRATRQTWEDATGGVFTTYMIATESPSQAKGSGEAYIENLAALFEEGSVSGQPLGDWALHGPQSATLFTYGKILVFVHGNAGADRTERFAREILGLLRKRYPKAEDVVPGPIALGKDALSGFTPKLERAWEWPVPVEVVAKEYPVQRQEWEDKAQQRWTSVILALPGDRHAALAAIAGVKGEMKAFRKATLSDSAVGPNIWTSEDGAAIVWVIAGYLVSVRHAGPGKSEPARTEAFAKQVLRAIKSRLPAPPTSQPATSQPSSGEKGSKPAR